MKVAIMQPYLFPYIGYFQLVNAVDKFIFYDDVSFIKGGWINRNVIEIQGEKKYINLTLIGASSFKNINEINVNGGQEKILKTIKQNYSKSPYFKQAFSVIEEVLIKSKDLKLISEIAGLSVMLISSYLGIDTKFEYSSKLYSNTKNLNRTDRLIQICKMNKADEYVNPIGGTELYDKFNFKEKEIRLKFIKTNFIQYKQFNDIFLPNLSIIDVIMFNNPETIKEFLTNHTID